MNYTQLGDFLLLLFFVFFFFKLIYLPLSLPFLWDNTCSYAMMCVMMSNCVLRCQNKWQTANVMGSYNGEIAHGCLIFAAVGRSRKRCFSRSLFLTKFHFLIFGLYFGIFIQLSIELIASDFFLKNKIRADCFLEGQRELNFKLEKNCLS